MSSLHARQRTSLILAIYVLVALIALAPLFVVDIPPLVDYPNHIARMHVIATQGTDDPAQLNYVVDWRPVPNLAMDLIVPPLTKLLPLTDAGRVFLGLAMLSLLSGILALHTAAFGHIGLSPLAGCLVLYNLPLAWGFVNFYFSIGLCILTFAAWIATRRWPAGARILLFSVAATALYFSHLFGLAAYVLLVSVYELRNTATQRGMSWRHRLSRIGATSAQFAPPAALYFANAMLWKEAIAPLNIGNWFGTVWTKGTAFVAGALFYGGLADALALGIACFVLILSLLCGWLTLSPRLFWPVVVLFLLTFLAPHVHGGLFLDARIGVIWGCVLIAGLRFDIPLKFAPAILVCLVAVFAYKSLSVAQTWRAHGKTYSAFRDALATLSPGARVLSAHDLPGARAELSYSPRFFMAGPAMQPGLSRFYSDRGLINLAVLERGAFVPSVFTYASAQPLRSADHNLHIDPVLPARWLSTALLLSGQDATASAEMVAEASANGEHPFWVDWPNHFDYVVVFSYGPKEDLAMEHLLRLHSDPRFDIYQVRRAGD